MPEMLKSWALRQAVRRGALEWDCTGCCAADEQAGVTFRPPMVGCWQGWRQQHVGYDATLLHGLG